MNLADRLRLELKSYGRVEKVLQWMRQSMELPEETSEYRQILEILQAKRDRIALLQSRVATGQ